MITAAVDYITELFRDNAGGHDRDHTLRVCRTALALAGHYPDCDTELVALAALLHDADDHKLFATSGNANARRFLEAQGIGPERTDLICEIINGVSFSKNRGKKPAALEGMIVQDADRLDAMGAIGIARTFAFGGEHGRSLASSIDHFHEKLLLLKDSMNTEAAKTMAKGRHAFLLEFLEEYRKEEEGRS